MPDPLRRFFLAPPATPAPAAGTVTERSRADIPDRYKWQIEDLYPDLDAWRAAVANLVAAIPSIRTFQGRLRSSPAVLADALDLMFTLDKDLSRAYVYASMRADEDTRDQAHQGMRQQMAQMAASFHAASSFIEPEILQFEPGVVEQYLAAEPRLEIYRVYLRDIVRRAAHTLSPAEEKLLADVGPLAGAPANIYNILSNADFPYPLVRLQDGTDVRINQANLSVYRASRNREDRAAVMSAFFTALGAFGRTLGTTMNGSVQKALFLARARRYGSVLEAALDGSNIPVSVYSRLVEGVNRHLPTFHRYLALRRRMLGVDTLHYYDLYAPLVDSVDLTYSPEESEAHILAAMAPLGDDYVSVLRRAFNERWIDLYPSAGKRSGAYSQGGAYDVHPYMLINYNGKYDDMGTIAHELGHTMQSHYSNQTQPYPTADYSIFVAEVASTFNESLLIDYMLGQIDSDDVRLALLGNYLEGIKGTVFRQTQFAEFELRMHEMAQAGDPITGDALASLYLAIARKYYGHDQGVSVVDDYIAHEWSYIPHFYREFYVFQYATSFTASEALAAKVKSGDRDAVRRYLHFLAAGSSKYPIDLLVDAGVDMRTDEPLELTMKEMNRVIDEMERLLANRQERTAEPH